MKRSKRRWSTLGLTAEGREAMFEAHAEHRQRLGAISHDFGQRFAKLRREHAEMLDAEHQRANAIRDRVIREDRKRVAEAA